MHTSKPNQTSSPLPALPYNYPVRTLTAPPPPQLPRPRNQLQHLLHPRRRAPLPDPRADTLVRRRPLRREPLARREKGPIDRHRLDAVDLDGPAAEYVLLAVHRGRRRQDDYQLDVYGHVAHCYSPCAYYHRGGYAELAPGGGELDGGGGCPDYPCDVDDDDDDGEGSPADYTCPGVD